MREYLWQAKPWQAFKTFAIIFSFTINLVLLVAILLLLPIILPGLSNIGRPLVGGLNDSFVQMGDARITRTIHVEDNVPVSFNLPLSQTTTVVLDSPVPVNVPAQFVFPGGGGAINGTVSLQLPAGMALPINLDIQVPVSNTLPISLDVAVDIPLDETELGTPFATLERLFAPLKRMLYRLPVDNDELFDRVNSQINRDIGAEQEVSASSD